MWMGMSCVAKLFNILSMAVGICEPANSRLFGGISEVKQMYHLHQYAKEDEEESLNEHKDNLQTWVGVVRNSRLATSWRELLALLG